MSKLTQRTAFFPLAVFCLLTGLFVQILVTSPTFAADDTNYESIVTKAAEADESEWLMPEGGTLKFKSMGVTLKAPPGAVKEPVLVTLRTIRPGAGHSISQVFELTAHNRNKKTLSKFEHPVVLSVKLQNSFSSANDKHKLYRWDDGRWVELKSDDRVSRGLVQGKTSLLGVFGVGR